MHETISFLGQCATNEVPMNVHIRKLIGFSVMLNCALLQATSVSLDLCAALLTFKLDFSSYQRQFPVSLANSNTWFVCDCKTTLWSKSNIVVSCEIQSVSVLN